MNKEKIEMNKRLKEAQDYFRKDEKYIFFNVKNVTNWILFPILL